MYSDNESETQPHRQKNKLSRYGKKIKESKYTKTIWEKLFKESYYLLSLSIYIIFEIVFTMGPSFILFIIELSYFRSTSNFIIWITIWIAFAICIIGFLFAYFYLWFKTTNVDKKVDFTLIIIFIIFLMAFVYLKTLLVFSIYLHLKAGTDCNEQFFEDILCILKNSSVNANSVLWCLWCFISMFLIIIMSIINSILLILFILSHIYTSTNVYTKLTSDEKSSKEHYIEILYSGHSKILIMDKMLEQLQNDTEDNINKRKNIDKIKTITEKLLIMFSKEIFPVVDTSVNNNNDKESLLLEYKNLPKREKIGDTMMILPADPITSRDMPSINVDWDPDHVSNDTVQYQDTGLEEKD